VTVPGKREEPDLGATPSKKLTRKAKSSGAALAATIKGDFRLSRDNAIFIHAFIEAIKIHAPEVVESMGEIGLTEGELQVSNKSMWATLGNLFEGVDIGEDETIALGAIKRIWQWAETHRLVIPINSLNAGVDDPEECSVTDALDELAVDSETDSLPNEEGECDSDESEDHTTDFSDMLDPMVHYHRTIILSVFNACRRKMVDPEGCSLATAWTVPQHSRMTLYHFANLLVDDGMAILEAGDEPPLLTTVANPPFDDLEFTFDDEGFPRVTSQPSVDYQFHFAIPGWDCFRETEVQAREQIIATFMRLLNNKFDAIRNTMSKLKDVSESPCRFQLDYFAWLVRFQVRKLPYQKASTLAEGKSRFATVKGVKAAAKYLIGPDFKRWLRQVRRGPSPD